MHKKYNKNKTMRNKRGGFSLCGWTVPGTEEKEDEPSPVPPNMNIGMPMNTNRQLPPPLYGGKRRMRKRGGFRGWTPLNNLASTASPFSGRTAQASYVGGRRRRRHTKKRRR